MHHNHIDNSLHTNLRSYISWPYLKS
jgi:hypothetical protein